MRLLILGGTAFLGREVALAGLERGHEVTCLARGSAPVPEGVAFVRGDRDQPDGLAGVASTSWDAVVDVTGHPIHVKRAVRDLQTDHWVFVSTANVYAPGAGADVQESAPLLAPFEGDRTDSMDTYGSAKVACEVAYRDSGTPATLVRAGLIGGPADTSGRSGYWPWRFAHPVSDEVVVVDDPDYPTALVDVRDLAVWIVLAAEEQLEGAFNVTGPTLRLSQVLDAAARAAGSTVRRRALPATRLAELGISAWMGPASLPLWIDDPSMRGFGTLDTSRALAAGLVCHPLEDTFRAALAYEESRSTPRSAGLSDEDEERALGLAPQQIARDQSEA